MVDLCAGSYIPLARLKKLKALGEGAFARGWHTMHQPAAGLPLWLVQAPHRPALHPLAWLAGCRLAGWLLLAQRDKLHQPCRQERTFHVTPTSPHPHPILTPPHPL